MATTPATLESSRAALGASALLVRPSRAHIGRVLAGAAAMYVVLQGGLTVLSGRLDMTGSALAVTAAMLALVVVIERFGFRRGVRAGFVALGFGRPTVGSIAAAGLISIGLLTFFPLYAAVTGTAFVLRSDWLWILAGAIALNGIAEETLFRGYVFGHLRQAGHSFRRAGLISLAIFGAIHLYLFIGNPPVVALLATLLAIAAAFPFAFLYQRAGNVIWAGVILHVSSHAFRLVEIPEGQVLTVGSAWILVQFAGVFLVYAFGKTLLKRRTDRADRSMAPRSA